MIAHNQINIFTTNLRLSFYSNKDTYTLYKNLCKLKSFIAVYYNPASIDILGLALGPSRILKHMRDIKNIMVKLTSHETPKMV